MHMEDDENLDIVIVDDEEFTKGDLRKNGLLVEINGKEYVDVTTFPLRYAPPKASFLENRKPGEYVLDRTSIEKRRVLRGDSPKVETEGYHIADTYLNTTPEPGPITRLVTSMFSFFM